MGAFLLSPCMSCAARFWVFIRRSFMCSCRFCVFMKGGEGRILLHCHLEPEPIPILFECGHIYLNHFIKGKKRSPPFSELKHFLLCLWLILSWWPQGFPCWTVSLCFPVSQCLLTKSAEFKVTWEGMASGLPQVQAIKGSISDESLKTVIRPTESPSLSIMILPHQYCTVLLRVKWHPPRKICWSPNSQHLRMWC